MRRFDLAGTAALLALSIVAGPATAAAQEAPSARTSKLLAQMAEASEKEDCGTILKVAPRVLKAPDVQAMPQLIGATHGMIALCEIERGRGERAYPHLLHATAHADAHDAIWHLRLIHELSRDDREAVATTLEAMSQGRGAALNSFPFDMIAQFYWQLSREGKQEELRKRVLRVVTSSGFVPDDNLGETDIFKIEYAGLLFDEGRTDEARALVQGLEDPRTIAVASLDHRFRSMFPEDLDLRKLTEASLARHRDLIGLHPDRLLPLNLASYDLVMLGRPGEAVKLLETARARIDDPGGFTDREDYLSWWWDALAEAHRAAGDYDSMVAALRQGARIAENGFPNVSQLLNLASHQASFGRGADALKTLEPFQDPKLGRSPYGEMVYRSARACALAAENRTDEAAADLAFAREHGKDGTNPYRKLLLCLDRLDDAAALTIGELQDPEKRAETLLALSDFESPLHRLPYSLHVRIEALKARPDVKAAIAAAGGIRRFNVQRPRY